jgi:phage recombination protein Bet
MEDSNQMQVVQSTLTKEQIQLIKDNICKGASDDELKLFIQQCNKTQLDPFSRQIYSIARWDKKTGREIRTTQVSIDGARLVAQRSNQYEGQDGPYWCGDDGKWFDVWLDLKPPRAAKVGVWRKNFRQPTWAIANWEAYAQTYTYNGQQQLSPMWKKMPALMLAKCAEMLALRKAFPLELSGLYSSEELGQIENESNHKQIEKKDEVISNEQVAQEEKKKRYDDFIKVCSKATKDYDNKQKEMFIETILGLKKFPRPGDVDIDEIENLIINVEAFIKEGE